LLPRNIESRAYWLQLGDLVVDVHPIIRHHEDFFVRSEPLPPDCNVSGEKKVSALQKKFAPQKVETMASRQSPRVSTHEIASGRAESSGHV
jgi:hypothetical protein